MAPARAENESSNSKTRLRTATIHRKTMAIAEMPFQAGRVEEAEAITKKLFEQFSQYTDLAECSAKPRHRRRGAEADRLATGGPGRLEPDRETRSAESVSRPGPTRGPARPSSPPLRMPREDARGSVVRAAINLVAGSRPLFSKGAQRFVSEFRSLELKPD